MTGLFVAGVPLVLGALFAAAAAILAAPALRVRRSWTKTTATVVDTEEFESGGETVRRVELRFRDGSDREWTSACRVFCDVAKYPQGAAVPVRFDPEHPENVRVDAFMEMWLFPSLVGASGAVAVIMGFCLAIALATNA